MNNREYTALVEKGQFPEDPTVPLDEPFVNGAGSIVNLITEKFTHAALITSRRGSVRANHYHKTDWHYALVLSGAIRYFWRPVGSRERPLSKTYTAGRMFFSPPLVEHAMYFNENTRFITFAKNERSDHATHEADLVRVPLVKSIWVPDLGDWNCIIDPDAVDER
jgi:dTDP-4-dehydrorhamnose 3,5-epimerase-like enzyme